jgi:hypothetical protein
MAFTVDDDNDVFTPASPLGGSAVLVVTTVCGGILFISILFIPFEPITWLLAATM